MDWSTIVNAISPYVVRIHTQFGYGTGFIFWQNHELCCIATANHVIEPANKTGWEQPILITQPCGKELRVYPVNRRIYHNLNKGDSAAILIYKEGLEIPENMITLSHEVAENSFMPIGTAVGWLGYPSIVSANIINPCFFSGVISNYFSVPEQYAIDGVGIHGVSGGPVFCYQNGVIQIIGSISEYEVNRRVSTGNSTETWPGLLVSHNVSVFMPIIKDLNNTLPNESTPETSDDNGVIDV